MCVFSVTYFTLRNSSIFEELFSSLSPLKELHNFLRMFLRYQLLYELSVRHDLQTQEGFKCTILT